MADSEKPSGGVEPPPTADAHASASAEAESTTPIVAQSNPHIPEMEVARSVAVRSENLAASLVTSFIAPLRIPGVPDFIHIGARANNRGVFDDGVMNSMLGRIIEASFEKPKPGSSRVAEAEYSQYFNDEENELYHAFKSIKQRLFVVVGEMTIQMSCSSAKKLYLAKIPDFKAFWVRFGRSSDVMKVDPRKICETFMADSTYKTTELTFFDNDYLKTTPDPDGSVAKYRKIFTTYVTITIQGLFTMEEMPAPRPTVVAAPAAAVAKGGTPGGRKKRMATVIPTPAGNGGGGTEPATGGGDGGTGQAPVEGGTGQAPDLTSPKKLTKAQQSLSNPTSLLARNMLATKGRRRPNSVVVLTSQVAPRRGQKSSAHTMYEVTAEHIALPDFISTFRPDPPAFIEHLNFLLKTAQDNMRTRKKPTIHDHVMATLIPMRIEELMQVPLQPFRDLTPDVANILTDYNMKEEFNRVRLKDCPRETGLLKILEKWGICLGPIMAVTACGKEFDRLTAKHTEGGQRYKADLDMLTQTSGPIVQEIPVDLLEKVTAAFAKRPRDVHPDDLDYGKGDLDFMLNATYNFMERMVIQRQMPPDKIMMALDYYFTLKALESPYCHFATFELVLALFNLANNGPYLEAAAKEFAERWAKGTLVQSVYPLDLWDSTPETFELMVFPDPNLQPMKKGEASKRAKAQKRARGAPEDGQQAGGPQDGAAELVVESRVIGDNGRIMSVRERKATEKLKVNHDAVLESMSNSGALRTAKRKQAGGCKSQKARKPAQKENTKRTRLGGWDENCLQGTDEPDPEPEEPEEAGEDADHDAEADTEFDIYRAMLDDGARPSRKRGLEVAPASGRARREPCPSKKYAGA